MKFYRTFAVVLLSAMILAGCDYPFDFTDGDDPTQPSGNTTGGQTAPATPDAAPSGSVSDYASLLASLKAAGLTVADAGMVEQPFFGVEGKIVKVNGQDIQVFEYPDAATAASDAAQVAPDGGSVGTSMVTWMAPPHFYRSGRLIVLYVGCDATVLSALTALGPQFAGQ